MAVKIYWSKRADKKFDEIIGFLTDAWGETVTKTFVRKVYDFLDILQEFPEVGSLESKENSIRGFVVVKQLTLFYKIKNDKIVLLNFFDNRMNPRKRKY